MNRRLISWICLALIMLLAVSSLTLAVSAEATVDSSELAVGESVQLSITIDGSSTAERPDISGVDGLEIDYLGPSTQIQIINGKYSSTVTHNFTVTAFKPGQYRLGPFRVRAGNQQLTTNAIELTVNNGGAGGAQSGTDRGSAAPEQIFLEMQPAKTRGYLGEQIPLKLRLFLRDLRVDDLSYPVLNQAEALIAKFEKPVQKKTVLNGLSYQVVEFSTHITPVKSGNFTLGPAAIDCSILVKRRSRDPFFDDFFNDYQKQTIQVKSKKVNFAALELPPGKPAGFSGGVGQFQLQAEASSTEVLQGDPFTVKLTVTGSGNLDSIGPPVLQNATGFKVYNPQKKTPAAKDGPINQAVFEQVLIPTDARVRQLGPFRLSYFDPRSGRYEQSVSRAIPLTVKPNPTYQSGQVSGPSTGGETIGRDLLFIKSDPGRLRAKTGRIHQQAWFWLLQAVPLLALLAAFGYRRRQNRLSADTPRARALRAAGLAWKRLHEAQRLLETGQHERLIDLLHSTIREYLGSRFGIPAAGITGTVVTVLEGHHLEPETLTRIKQFFDDYDALRFTGAGANATAARRLHELASAIVHELERSGKAKQNRFAPREDDFHEQL
jgi:hypothetical protein